MPKEVEQYTHDDKERMNNPPVGLVTPDTDRDGGKMTYQYDPQLQWAGKAEHTSFEVDTVSLHVHERIDPKTIIDSVKKEDEGKIQVEVAGFDYYDPRSGNVESGNKGDIAMWMLDTDYDGRSLLPRQVFFPMAGAKEGWSRLARNLKAEIDEEKIEAFRGTVSLPFKPGMQVAIKIIDGKDWWLQFQSRRMGIV